MLLAKGLHPARFLLTDTYSLQNDETEPHDGHTAKARHSWGCVRIVSFASGVGSSTEAPP